MISDTTDVIQSINLTDEEMVSVSYSFEVDFVEMMSNINIVIAAYTTAQARLMVYFYLLNDCEIMFATLALFKLVGAPLYDPVR